MSTKNQITPAELNALIGTPKCPLVLDVRREAVFAASSSRIAASYWHDISSIESVASVVRADQSVVVYCAHGHNVSAMAATRLRAIGIPVRVLEGGIAAFEENGGLLTKKSVDLPRGSARNPTVWVTRERPKIDRIACPWLIRRFVDPFSKFHFVDGRWVRDICDEMGATAFDVDGVRWSHRGAACTFDTIIDEYGLSSPALSTVANIVRAADTSRLDLAPQAAGLLALSLGISHLYHDDLEQLEAGLPLYDALYTWARYGQSETHNWPAKVQS